MTSRAFGAPKKSKFIEKPSNPDLLAGYELGDTIGSFYANLRRSRVKKDGLMAQFFGENGEDADFISLLHNTRFLNALLKVSVFLIKDSTGRSFTDQGKNPLLSEFIAVNYRPSPSDAGQTAQFFGADGVNADAINTLNETRFLDALVLVEIQKAEPGLMAADIHTVVDPALIKEGTSRLTSEEVKAQKKDQKKAETAMEALIQSRFFHKEPVLFALGKPEAYQKWITSQLCCHPMPSGQPSCSHGPVQALEVKSGRLRQFRYVPMCMEHYKEWSGEFLPEIGGSGPQKFLESQNYMLANRWAIEQLVTQLHVPAGYLPSPRLVLKWAIDNKVTSHLPSHYELNFIQ